MSDISIISWNICRSLSDKLTNSDFISLVSRYDLIFLSECWITDDDNVEIDGYEKFIFPRKQIKGGGIVIYCRLNLLPNICVIENNLV